MAAKEINQQQQTQSWERYWQSDQGSQTQISDQLKQQCLTPLWQRFLRQAFIATPNAVTLEIGCGDGYLADLNAPLLPASSQLLCLDISTAAAQWVEQKHPRLAAVAANANALPLADHSVDIVISQFGIEYAGAAAFAEVGRVLKPKGKLLLFCHQQGSSIFQECHGNRQTLQAFIDSQVMPLAAAAFRAGYRILAGQGSQQAFRDADKALAPAVEQVKQLLLHPQCDADQFLRRVFADLGKMYGRIQHYQADDVSAWFNHNNQAIVEYLGRMQSMTDAALSTAQTEQITAQLAQAGILLDCTAVQHNTQPLGWVFERK
ncbi:class I SAM-dependent methyltransferase [uncultured Ferrimonas sp.]|uniref:class I SAM-dependent methyltransferase n=1 Tax=uncultured Ferrimonas sp. TaxID=432640 RepID=UPI002615BC6C|nr:class I SAM-dependent methyltransferase [uncultured Ferrimonas sp.]